MIFPSRSEFIEQSQRGNLIPVWKEVLADVETPVSAFMKLAKDRPNSFLLESVAGGEHLARYSFLGTDPVVTFRSKGNTGELREGARVQPLAFGPGRDPLHALAELMARYRYVPSPLLPPFSGGAVGMVAYDAVRFFEKLPERAKDDLRLDDFFFLLTDTLLIFDHVRHRMLALCNVHVRDGVEPGKAYDEAGERIAAMLWRLQAPLPAPASAPAPSSAKGEFISNRTEADYKAAVLRAKEYVTAGDTFQVQIAQRLSKPLHAHPFDVYRALRSINPSPYMFYLDFGDAKLVGASPEVLVSKSDRAVKQRPIAGTRHGRGASPREDEAIAQGLLADEKERAEHIMLVDLARNDIGRVARYGSVQVNELMVIEKYSHVMHLVSEVTGALRDEVDLFELIRASFPAGTLTGAPKVRTMEIIEELEPTRRAHYGGGVGYLSYGGDMDLAITIRTALVKDGMIHLQAAGGVVADSEPEYEYQETLAKMRALVRAVEWAERGLA
ncbi:MAG: anthranilate synthase component I [Myxococcaceae bacterium]